MQEIPRFSYGIAGGLEGSGVLPDGTPTSGCEWPGPRGRGCQSPASAPGAYAACHKDAAPAGEHLDDVSRLRDGVDGADGNLRSVEPEELVGVSDAPVCHVVDCVVVYPVADDASKVQEQADEEDCEGVDLGEVGEGLK